MYFWRIEKLKTRMAARPLSDRETLPYLVVFTCCYAAMIYIPRTTFNLWDGLGATWSTLLAVFGTIYIYKQNGGANGQHLLQRCLALGWVVAIRWLVALVVIFIPLSGSLFILQVPIEDDTQWYHCLFFAIAEAFLYWRIGHHVGDLASRTNGA